ncbi:MAG TPA: PASTA domain-containing protein, partial [Thermoleophilia bacterium]|nr:PASTA domain-containing protein [Thermoleophilia bacterium]
APAPVPAPPRPRRVWPWIVAGLVALGVLIVALLWILGVFTPKVTVPNVTGMALSQATATLDNAGLKVGAVTFQQATGKTQGTVLSQAPAAGASADKGSRVALTTVGQSVQTVPNVVGMAQSQATAAITSAGFALGNVTLVYDSTIAAGNVVDQAPSAGVTAPGGTPIALTVSKGPQPSSSPQAQAVPDVTGQPQANAISTLQSAGFTVVVDKLPSTTVPNGTVIDQTPSGGVFASKGSTVTIVVSTGGSTPTPSP